MRFDVPVHFARQGACCDDVKDGAPSRHRAATPARTTQLPRFPSISEHIRYYIPCARSVFERHTHAARTSDALRGLAISRMASACHASRGSREICRRCRQDEVEFEFRAVDRDCRPSCGVEFAHVPWVNVHGYVLHRQRLVTGIWTKHRKSPVCHFDETRALARARVRPTPM